MSHNSLTQYNLFYVDREEMEYRRPQVKPWEVNPESVPRSRYYFEHDNRENFQGFRGSYRGSFRGRGRGRGFIKRKFYVCFCLFFIFANSRFTLSYINDELILFRLQQKKEDQREC